MRVTQGTFSFLPTCRSSRSRRQLGADDLMTIEAEEIRASRVFSGGIDADPADEEAAS